MNGQTAPKKPTSTYSTSRDLDNKCCIAASSLPQVRPRGCSTPCGPWTSVSIAFVNGITCPRLPNRSLRDRERVTPFLLLVLHVRSSSLPLPSILAHEVRLAAGDPTGVRTLSFTAPCTSRCECGNRLMRCQMLRISGQYMRRR